jgi:hypothetical protein
MEFKLLNNHILKIEPEKEKPSKVRIIIKQMGKELICRKEGINALLDFLYDSDSRLVNGRLQINKTKTSVSFYINGDIIGSVEAKDLVSGLNKL